jgi:hypothetical protein
MAVRLVSGEDADGELPLAFLQYEHLKEGTATPFRANGREVYGASLDRLLESEGIGEKRVEIELQFAMSGAGALEKQTLSTTIAGTLDSGSLARVIHAQARQFTGKYRKGDSPQLAFVTAITVGSPEKPQRPVIAALPPADLKALASTYRVKIGPKGGAPKVVRHRDKRGRAYYLDKRTGKQVRASVWQLFKATRTKRG